MTSQESPGTASAYEQQALRQIQIWKSPELGMVGKAMQLLNKPIDTAGDLFLKTPGVGWVIQKSVGGITGVANDLAHWSVRPGAIH